MGWLVNFAKSSIGAKVVMAVTGIMLVGFVIAHMAGNLQVFLGPDAINTYAAMLKSTGALLWTARLGLLAAVALHIASGLRLAKLNREARPERYAHEATVQATLSSRWMAASGIMLLAFIVYHLLQFTLGVTDPHLLELVDTQGRHDVYSMMILGFQHPLVALSYIVAMLLLGMHLNHGATSMFQSLGLNHPKYNPLIKRVGPTLAGVVVIGNVSMPLAAWMGWIQPVVGG